MIVAFTSVSWYRYEQRIILNNIQSMAPITGPATPPTPPLMAFPPMTTPVTEFRVMEAPISAFPDPLNMVMAMPDKAAMKPETTYVLNWINVTGTAVSTQRQLTTHSK
jgi:hypothetical protein